MHQNVVIGPVFAKFPVNFPVSRELDAETGSLVTASSANNSQNSAPKSSFRPLPEYARYFRGLAVPRSRRSVPETKNVRSWGVNGGRVSRAAFRVNGCRASGQIFGRGSDREAEKRPLLFPVVGQALTQFQKPSRRQLDRLAAGEDRLDDIRREIGQADQ